MTVIFPLFNWTPEHKEFVASCVREGLSKPEIIEAFRQKGHTINSNQVAGMIHRLGLKVPPRRLRASPAPAPISLGGGAEPQPKEAPRDAAPDYQRKIFEWSPEQIEMLRGLAFEGKSGSQAHKAFTEAGYPVSLGMIYAAAKRNGIRFESIYMPRPAPAGSKPPDLSVIKAAEAVDPGANMIPLFDEDGNACFGPLSRCRWITGDVRERSAMICADPAIPGSSFCTHHHKAAWIPFKPRAPKKKAPA